MLPLPLALALSPAGSGRISAKEQASTPATASSPSEGGGSAKTTPRRSWRPWGATSPDKSALPVDKETAEAATKIQKGFRAKRSARGKPGPKAGSTGSADEQRAASTIQASFRRRGKAAKESLDKVGKVGREAKESIRVSHGGAGPSAQHPDRKGPDQGNQSCSRDRPVDTEVGGRGVAPSSHRHHK